MSGGVRRYNPCVALDETAILGLRPGAELRGAARVPGSKSIAQRGLLLASLSGGRTRLAGLPGSQDVRSTRALVTAVGARVETLAPAAVAVEGRPPGPERGWESATPLMLGESGTLARMATAVAGLCGRAGSRFELLPEGTLARRSSAPLLRALRQGGVRTDPADGVAWPLRVFPIGPPDTLTLIDPVSSQEVSALLVALAAWPGEHLVRVEGALPSRPYLELTRSMLRHFGVRVSATPGDASLFFELRGGLRPPEDPITIEPDASNAAVVLAAGCLSGGEVEVRGLGSRSSQGDLRVVEYLARFGCETEASAERVRAGGRPKREVLLNLHDEPDLAPVLAAVAAAHAWEGGAGSLLTGLGTLPLKESQRIDVLAHGFETAGIACESGPDFLRVGPRQIGEVKDVLLDPHGDHRMAFAFALLGLARPGVRVKDARCVNKSWPGFWSELQRLGAQVA
jgi:3-phosphoshikimate 1-carboxyvinyltransferase